MYILGKLLNWDFKHNILGKIIVLGNWTINLFLEKFILSQIAIVSHKML